MSILIINIKLKIFIFYKKIKTKIIVYYLRYKIILLIS